MDTNDRRDFVKMIAGAGVATALPSAAAQAQQQTPKYPMIELEAVGGESLGPTVRFRVLEASFNENVFDITCDGSGGIYIIAVDDNNVRHPEWGSFGCHRLGGPIDVWQFATSIEPGVAAFAGIDFLSYFVYVQAALALWPTPLHGSATLIGTGGTIGTAAAAGEYGYSSRRVTAASTVTGAILQAGTQQSPGQTIVVINESANSITFAASATSNVATGAACVIAANKAKMFIWSPVPARWYECS